MIEWEPRTDGQSLTSSQIWLQERRVRQARAKAQVRLFYEMKQVRAQEVRKLESLWCRAQVRGDLAAESMCARVLAIFRSSQSYYERALASAFRRREWICRPL